MGVNNPGGGGGASSGTAAARPASASPGTLYWATDTNEISCFVGGAWNFIKTLSGGGTSGGISITNGGIIGNGGAAIASVNNNGWVFENGNGAASAVNIPPPAGTVFALGTQASFQAATATAGAGAALPATVQGYVTFTDIGGTNRKIPFYAT